MWLTSRNILACTVIFLPFCHLGDNGAMNEGREGVGEREGGGGGGRVHLSVSSMVTIGYEWREGPLLWRCMYV